MNKTKQTMEEGSECGSVEAVYFDNFHYNWVIFPSPLGIISAAAQSWEAEWQ